jgi:hypothetical protein
MSYPLLRRAALIGFWAALIFCFYEAIIPPSSAIPLFPWDKAEHFVAFYGLTGLAVAAYPRSSLILIAGLLSGFGALIEAVQALPVVHRDADFWDWFTDTVAIFAALAPMLLVWWREEWRGGFKPF